MANTIKLTKIAAGAQALEVFFKVALSGNYTQLAGGGEVLDFTKAVADAGFIGLVPAIPASNQTPLAGWVASTTGQTNYCYFFVAGALNACKLKVISAYNTELAGGAYPAAVTGDTIEGSFVLSKNL